MNRIAATAARTLVALLVVSAGPAVGDDFDVDWFTIDGGGDMWTAGGEFELSGTIGQADAGAVMTGADFTLVGGFWAGLRYSLGDLNCDGTLDAFDIDPFVLALTDPPRYMATYPHCDLWLADIDGDGWITAFDIDPFVELLTGG